MKAVNFLISVMLAFHLTTAAAMGLDPYSEKEFIQAQNDNGTVVLAFHSASCGTCKIQAPALDSLLKEDSFKSLSGMQVHFEDSKDLRKKFRVNSPSTVVVVRNGQEVARSTGITDISELRKVLQKGIQQ